MVEITGIIPILSIFLGFLLFQIQSYCKERSETSQKLSSKLFFSTIYFLMFNLMILMIPITINLTWFSLSASETSPATLDSLISIFKGLTTLIWLIYYLYLTMLILYMTISAFELFKTKKEMKEEVDGYTEL